MGLKVGFILFIPFTLTYSSLLYYCILFFSFPSQFVLCQLLVGRWTQKLENFFSVVFVVLKVQIGVDTHPLNLFIFFFFSLSKDENDYKAINRLHDECLFVQATLHPFH